MTPKWAFQVNRPAAGGEAEVRDAVGVPVDVQPAGFSAATLEIVVPEPGTVALVVLGGAMMTLLRRRVHPAVGG